LQLLPSLKVLVTDMLFSNIPPLPSVHTLDIYPNSANMKEVIERLPNLRNLFAYNATNPVEGVVLIDNIMSKYGVYFFIHITNFMITDLPF